jgi:CheY-like chemotaxis protein
MNILIVDDQVQIRDLLCRVVRLYGHRPFLAEDGDAAIRVLASGGIDVLLTDLRMPVVDGAELVRRLRSDPATSRIPVILLTGTADLAHIRSAVDAGIDLFLQKPVHLGELQLAIERAVALCRERGNMATAPSKATARA